MLKVLKKYDNILSKTDLITESNDSTSIKLNNQFYFVDDSIMVIKTIPIKRASSDPERSDICPYAKIIYISPKLEEITFLRELFNYFRKFIKAYNPNVIALYLDEFSKIPPRYKNSLSKAQQKYLTKIIKKTRAFVKKSSNISI